MKKENYKIWDIKISNFFQCNSSVGRLCFLINFASLAPSSHNSQPWKFGVRDNSILVFKETSRSLTFSDSNDRQLFISLGCAIKNILIAADYFGYSVDIKYFPNNLRDCIALLTLVETSNVSKNKEHLIFSILNRVTNRDKYEERLPNSEFLIKIKSLETPSLKLDFVLDEFRKCCVADITLRASAEAMRSREFRRELSKYVKPNITHSPIGMPGFGMGFSTLASFVAPVMLRHFDLSKLTYKQDELLLKKFTPMFVVISTERDDPVHWLQAGVTYEEIALSAEKEGIKTSVWAAAIQIGDYFKKLQRVLGHSFRPQVFFRMGYNDKKIHHTPRFSLKDLIVHV